MHIKEGLTGGEKEETKVKKGDLSERILATTSSSSQNPPLLKLQGRVPEITESSIVRLSQPSDPLSSVNRLYRPCHIFQKFNCVRSPVLNPILSFTSCKYFEISTRRGLSFRRRDRPVRYSVFKHSPTSVHHHVPVDMFISVDHIDSVYILITVDSLVSARQYISVDSFVPLSPLVLTDPLSVHGYGLVTPARGAMIYSSEPAIGVYDQTFADNSYI
ncbi:hypothetical protein GQ457_16G016030 [Hibiscus cannabinus]